jgi:putative endonuclease
MAAHRIDAALMGWFVYVLECRDGTLYTGVAVDVQARFAQHAAGKGARYTRSHPPLRVLASFECADRSEAQRREAAIKRMTAARKRELCLPGGSTSSWRRVASDQ